MDIGGSGEIVEVEDAEGGVGAAWLMADLSCGLDGWYAAAAAC